MNQDTSANRSVSPAIAGATTAKERTLLIASKDSMISSWNRPGGIRKDGSCLRDHSIPGNGNGDGRPMFTALTTLPRTITRSSTPLPGSR